MANGYIIFINDKIALSIYRTDVFMTESLYIFVGLFIFRINRLNNHKTILCSRRIQLLVLKMTEQLFIYKKSLTDVNQLGNIRIR